MRSTGHAQGPQGAQDSHLRLYSNSTWASISLLRACTQALLFSCHPGSSNGDGRGAACQIECVCECTLTS
jgi:hypothetical protein